MSIEEARQEARYVLAEMSSGVDPNAAKKADKASALTLDELLEIYLAAKELRESTKSFYRRIIRRCLKDWLDKPITKITKDMVEDRHKQMSNGTTKGTSGRATANGCFKTLQALLNYAAERFEIDGQPLILSNPVGRLTRTRAWYRVHPRTGVIPEAKMRDWYMAVKELEQQHVADYFVLLVFTGLRRNEGLCLKWDDIDFEARTLTVRRDRAKNHLDHVLPLSTFLFNLLKRRHDNRTPSPYVFPGRFDVGHLTDFRFALAQVRKRSRCRFMLHDCRRTFLSAAERLECPYYVLKRLANHKVSSDTLTPYIQVSDERLRTHMEKISQHFQQLMGMEVAEGVAVVAKGKKQLSVSTGM